jgi:hypothetical protein
MRVLNLDEICSDNVTVKIAGEDYIVPGDLPAETMLKLLDAMGATKDKPDDSVLIAKLHECLLDTLAIKNTIVDRSKIKKYMTMKRYNELIKFLFGVDEAEKKSLGQADVPRQQ